MGKFLVAHGWEPPPPSKHKTIHFMRDVTPYRSPLSQKEITSRSQRREEMKEFNVREVDPSEGPHRDKSVYNSQRSEQKYSPKHKRS